MEVVEVVVVGHHLHLEEGLVDYQIWEWTTLDRLNLALRSGMRTRAYTLGGKRLYITAAEANANISHYSGRHRISCVCLDVSFGVSA